MRNNILLTSLIAISVAFGAHAETDLTFAGDYTLNNTTVNINDDVEIPDATYQYTNTAGETITAAYNEDPDLTQFTYSINGDEYYFSDGYNLTQDDFHAPGHADGVTVFGPEAIYDPMNTAHPVGYNYEYINGDGERVPYAVMTQEVQLNSTYGTYWFPELGFPPIIISVTNGSSGDHFGPDLYHGEVDGVRYNFNSDASGLTTYDTMNGWVDVDISDNAELTELYNNMHAAYEQDQAAIQAVVDAQTAVVNDPGYQAASQVRMQDMLTQMTLFTEYNAFNTSKNKLIAAQEAQAAAAEEQETNLAVRSEAEDLYNAPILETIRNTSNEEIAESIENGAIGDAIAASENTLRNEYRSADELVLKSAKAYTDKKVSKLEDTLSAGIASSAALSSVAVSNVKRGELSVGGGYGNYNTKSAFALGAAMGLTNNWSVNAGAGMDSNGDHVAFRAGTNYKFKLF